MKGRYNEARYILNRISRANKIEFPDKLAPDEKEQSIKTEEVCHFYRAFDFW